MPEKTLSWRQSLLLLLACVTAYFAVPSFHFVYDDQQQILENPTILHLSAIPHYFTQSVWAFYGGVAPLYYRPMLSTWFNINCALFGAHAAGWHIGVLLLHMIATILLFHVVFALLQERRIALFSALLFAVHPVHLESVAWVVGGIDPLLTCFTLASFLFYLRSTESSGRRRLTRIGISLLFFAFALLTKETAVMLPLVIALHALLFRYGRPLASRLNSTLPYFVVVVVFLLVRSLVLGSTGKYLQPLTWSMVLLTIPSVLWFYVRLLFYPVGLSVFYDSPYVTSARNPHFYLPVLGLITLLVFVGWAILKTRARQEDGFDFRPALWLSLCWMAVFVAPTLDFFAFSPNEIAHDRYIYLPSIGFVVLVAFALTRLADRIALPANLRVIAGGTLLLVAAMTTAVQSFNWANPYALYTRGIKSAPLSWYARNDLAILYADHGDAELAIKMWKEILLNYPNAREPVLNLGRAYFKQGKYDLAVPYLRRAAFQNPTGSTLFYLGVALLKTGSGAEAEQALLESLQRNPDSAAAHKALGMAYELEGNWQQAKEALEKAHSMEPGDPQTQAELAKVRSHLGT